MPITGKFLADFSSFVSEVDTALEALHALQLEANGAQASLTEVAGVDPAGLESLSAAAQAVAADVGGIGAAASEVAGNLGDLEPALKPLEALADDAGAAKTALEGVKKADPAPALDQVKKSANDAGAAFAALEGTVKNVLGALGLGLSVGGVIAYGKAIMDTAGDIQRLADQTGLATDQVQGLMYAAEQTNTPMAAFENGITKIQQGIGSEDSGLMAATRRLGLSWESLKKATPYDAFVQYSSAIATVTDRNEQAALGVAVLGKNWKELAPAVKAGIDTLVNESPKMTDTAIKGWNDLDSAIKRATLSLKTYIGELAGRLNLAALVPEIPANTGPKEPAMFGTSADDREAWIRWITATQLGLAKLQETGANLPATLGAITVSGADLKAEQLAMARDLKATTEAIAAAEAAYKKWKEATEELNQTGKNWAQTLTTIDGAVVEAIRGYLAAGQSQSVLAAAYGLSATQVRAVADGIEAEKNAMIEANKLGAAALEIHKAEVELRKSEVAARNADIQQMLEADKTSHAYYVKLADDARSTYEIVRRQQGQVSDERLQQLRDQAEAAERTLADWQNAATGAMNATKGAAEQAGDAIRALGGAVDTIVERFTAAQNTFLAASQQQVAGRFVPPASSGFYTIGPNGERVPASGTINVPAARSLAPSVTMQSGAVTMNYPIMNDPTSRDEIGRLVGQSVVEQLTRAGYRQ